MTGRTPPVHPPCTCGHLDVLHNLSPSTGRRTGCSISSGPTATPCGCKAYEPESDDGLFARPEQPTQGGGAHL